MRRGRWSQGTGEIKGKTKTKKRTGRRKPYTEIGVRRLKCIRCGEQAVHQWNACADGNLWRPICQECDILLNRLVLMFMFPNNQYENNRKIERYIETLERKD